jgi:hypothetical protein
VSTPSRTLSAQQLKQAIYLFDERAPHQQVARKEKRFGVWVLGVGVSMYPCLRQFPPYEYHYCSQIQSDPLRREHKAWCYLMYAPGGKRSYDTCTAERSKAHVGMPLDPVKASWDLPGMRATSTINLGYEASVSDIREAVAWARSANQPVYVLCTEYSSFPCGARCANPRAPSNSQTTWRTFIWRKVADLIHRITMFLFAWILSVSPFLATCEAHLVPHAAPVSCPAHLSSIWI